MSEHIKAQWASSPEYSTHKETDLYTPEANSVSSSCSSLDSQESSLSVMLETLACDGPCRQLMELKILKSFDCGHVFCETCLLEAIAKGNVQVKCPAKKCVRRSQFQLSPLHNDGVKEHTFVQSQNLCLESSTISPCSSSFDTSSPSSARS
ncbi:hypothetical protein QR680_012999 [Steinernema hermaphroditum]|uniref:RING-type domain-containing protein n=1 Tax=Steinernema hermaphroditum TaxID=289476 RepID=A0AA39M1I8_9BILA|nr:hypothetical protein QR680_012999 [Steinernema hermaphroditum]